MFSMFGKNAEQGPPQKRPHRLKNVREQRNISWPVPLWEPFYSVVQHLVHLLHATRHNLA